MATMVDITVRPRTVTLANKATRQMNVVREKEQAQVTSGRGESFQAGFPTPWQKYALPCQERRRLVEDDQPRVAGCVFGFCLLF